MRSFLCGVAARMKASVLPRRCSAMPDQLPTLNIGTLILSHCACDAAERAAVEIVVQPEMQRIDLPAVGLMLRGAAEHDDAAYAP